LEAFPPNILSRQGTNNRKISWGTCHLSERELQVPRLIEAGYSYQQIAEDLVIALSTVQTHIRNVCTKLDVHSALEAIQVASQLNLFK
jgi:ATP/maltotriose-dependent transcriptional regulator MalT